MVSDEAVQKLQLEYAPNGFLKRLGGAFGGRKIVGLGEPAVLSDGYYWRDRSPVWRVLFPVRTESGSPCDYTVCVNATGEVRSINVSGYHPEAVGATDKSGEISPVVLPNGKIDIGCTFGRGMSESFKGPDFGDDDMVYWNGHEEWGRKLDFPGIEGYKFDENSRLFRRV